MRLNIGAVLLACMLWQADPAGARAPRHSTQPARPSLEGVWAADFVLTMEATSKTPALTVPEAQAKVLGAAVGEEIAREFEKGLDPEAPALIRASQGLPIVRGQRRTRLVVEPADGKLPYTPRARAELTAPPKESSSDNPEQRSDNDRCLVGLGQPPLTSFIYENRLQIVITRDFAVLHTEYGDEVRIVPLAGPHAPRVLASRLGDSIGHWEGPTLVIETVDLPDADRVRPFPFYIVPGEATVIERLTPVSGRELLYQFTIVDPKTYTAPWLAEFSWFRTKEPMFEHACHEGNYSLANILAGARHEEAVARAAAGH